MLVYVIMSTHTSNRNINILTGTVFQFLKIFLHEPPFDRIKPIWCRLTLQDVDRGAVIPLLDDTAAFGQAGGMHTVHDGQDLHTWADPWPDVENQTREKDAGDSWVITCPCSRCFMKSLSIRALWISSLDLQLHKMVKKGHPHVCPC